MPTPSMSICDLSISISIPRVVFVQLLSNPPHFFLLPILQTAQHKQKLLPWSASLTLSAAHHAFVGACELWTPPGQDTYTFTEAYTFAFSYSYTHPHTGCAPHIFPRFSTYSPLHTTACVFALFTLHEVILWYLGHLILRFTFSLSLSFSPLLSLLCYLLVAMWVTRACMNTFFCTPFTHVRSKKKKSLCLKWHAQLCLLSSFSRPFPEPHPDI